MQGIKIPSANFSSANQAIGTLVGGKDAVYWNTFILAKGPGLQQISTQQLYAEVCAQELNNPFPESLNPISTMTTEAKALQMTIQVLTTRFDKFERGRGRGIGKDGHRGRGGKAAKNGSRGGRGRGHGKGRGGKGNDEGVRLENDKSKWCRWCVKFRHATENCWTAL